MEVRTTVTLPTLEAEGMKQGGRVYIDRRDVSLWLEQAADECDKAHGNADIGKTLRVCAQVFREVKAS